MAWRGPGFQGPVPPEPWPGRHDAFLTACAMVAGRREKDLLTMLEAFAGSGKDAPPPAEKPRNPLRLG